MVFKLFLMFSAIPLVELYVLLKVGSLVGPLATIVLVVATAILGAFLAKWQGLSTFFRIQEQLAAGVVPGDDIIEGILILLASLVLLTPGLVTDTVGFLLLLPFTRAKAREYVKRMIGRRYTRAQKQKETVYKEVH